MKFRTNGIRQEAEAIESVSVSVFDNDSARRRRMYSHRKESDGEIRHRHCLYFCDFLFSVCSSTDQNVGHEVTPDLWTRRNCEIVKRQATRDSGAKCQSDAARCATIDRTEVSRG